MQTSHFKLWTFLSSSFVMCVGHNDHHITVKYSGLPQGGGELKYRYFKDLKNIKYNVGMAGMGNGICYCNLKSFTPDVKWSDDQRKHRKPRVYKSINAKYEVKNLILNNEKAWSWPHLSIVVNITLSHDWLLCVTKEGN